LSLFIGQPAQSDRKVGRWVRDGDELVARSCSGDDGDVSAVDVQGVGQGSADGFVRLAVDGWGGDGDDQGWASVAVPSAADRCSVRGWADPDEESVFGHRRLSGYWGRWLSTGGPVVHSQPFSRPRRRSRSITLASSVITLGLERLVKPIQSDVRPDCGIGKYTPEEG
jgi:hypothetical protein